MNEALNGKSTWKVLEMKKMESVVCGLWFVLMKKSRIMKKLENSLMHT